MKRFAALILLLLMLPPTAAGQFIIQSQSCPGGTCPTSTAPPSYLAMPAGPTIAASTKVLLANDKQLANGWYKHESGCYREYRDGLEVRCLWPNHTGWDDALRSMSDSAKEQFGLVVVRESKAPIAKKSAANRSTYTPTPLEDFIAFADDLGSAPPPKTRDLPASDDKSDPFPGGVANEKIPQQLSYAVNGVNVAKAGVYRCLLGESAGGALTDDRGKMFLTIVGDEAMRKKVLGNLASDPSLRSKLHVNAFAPDSWQVQQIGFPSGVTLQGPPDAAGRSPVIWRFREAPNALALAEAIRKADPNYQPNADPDPAKPAPAPTPTPAPGPVNPAPTPAPKLPFDTANLPLYILLALGGGVLAYILSKKGTI